MSVELRPISEISDPMILLSWRNSPEIYKWCRQNEPLTEWDHLKWFNSLKDRSDVKMYSIWTYQKVDYPQMGPNNSTKEKVPIGVCGLTSIDLINRRAEFSLYISPGHHKNGFGQEALRLLCKKGFNVLGLKHIFGETFDGNPAAKMFEKVGFKKEGTRRSFYFRDGKFIDAHLYSMLSEEFTA